MVFGPRFLVEAGFIVAVAVVAGIADVGTWSIIALVAAAWLLVALVEIALWKRTARARGPAPEASDPARPREPEPEPVVVRPAPIPAPEPPRLAAAPPPPEPDPAPAPEPEPEPQPEPEIAYLPLSGGPREWNLWELERLARGNVTDDIAQNEERSYLLMYLREFAGSDGTLPADFDGLVRDAFADLLSVAAT